MTMGHTKKPRVLCVDDEPSVLRALTWLLKSRFEVSSTTDTQEGLSLLRKNAFEVVISDQRMPGMTGTEFLQRAKIESPNTMRLLLTGYSDYADILGSVNDSEVFRFINKPWDNQQLLETVNFAASVAQDAPLPGAESATPLDDEDSLSGTGNEVVMLLDPDPAMERQLREALGDEVLLLWARDVTEAVGMLTRHKVAVLMAETAVGANPTLDLIRAVKRSLPEVVVLMLSAERDSVTIGRLINEGQIFRFIGKPVGPGYARRMVRSALAKHRDLLARPLYIARHAVQRSDDEDFERAYEIASGARGSAAQDASSAPAAGAGRTWLHRLFARA